MGISTNIKLPLWVKMDNLTNVVDKIVGNTPVQHIIGDHSYMGGIKRESKKPVDFSKPCKKNNSWIIDFDPHAELMDVTESFGHRSPLLTLCFQDLNETTYGWYFHLDTSAEDHRLLNPGYNPEAVLIGRKLVDFFGGTVVYNDCLDDDDKGNTYTRKTGFFPLITQEQKKDEDLRFFQFYNKLNMFPLATENEMLEIEKKHGSTERYESLKQSIRKARQLLIEKHVESSLKNKPNKIRKPKI